MITLYALSSAGSTGLKAKQDHDLGHTQMVAGLGQQCQAACGTGAPDVMPNDKDLAYIFP